MRVSLESGMARLTVLAMLGFLTFACWPVQMADAASADPMAANSESDLVPSSVWSKKVEAQWGGHLKARGVLSWYEDDSIFEPVGTGTFQDGSGEFRLKSRVLLGDWGNFDADYEAVLSGGETRRKQNELEDLFPDLFRVLPGSSPPEDDRRFMDLTSTISEDESAILYHRLDRLSLTLLPRWGIVSIGRQAVTWGNGFLFNPMDLFNPFSPTDVERDYKIGDDLVFAQVSTHKLLGFQTLYVPRRDPMTGDAQWDESSLAGKGHFALGTTEVDLMAAKHYEDVVVGWGSVGYLGDAAWRFDVTWTILEDDSRMDGFLSLVSNVDYSWVWWEKNFYGFLESYYNGLGEDDYREVLSDPNVRDRLARGELFALGRAYLSGAFRVEIHPLFQAYLTVICNIEDPSGVIQPRATWDVAENVEITAGLSIFYGGAGTEYGGFEIPGTGLRVKPADTAYLWLSYFF